jgi:hypothetical protein
MQSKQLSTEIKSFINTETWWTPAKPYGKDIENISERIIKNQDNSRLFEDLSRHILDYGFTGQIGQTMVSFYGETDMEMIYWIFAGYKKDYIYRCTREQSLNLLPEQIPDHHILDPDDIK